jgi:tetratricopeptide (TPR) repeat protein
LGDAYLCHPIYLPTSRIEMLQNLLAQDPSSVFARYGLAMEYVNTGDPLRAIPEFEAVLATNPSYSAAYYHGGQTLEKLGRLDEARDFYRRGLAASTDPHARGELQAALDILGE